MIAVDRRISARQLINGRLHNDELKLSAGEAGSLAPGASIDQA
jgi:hypothetical protein